MNLIFFLKNLISPDFETLEQRKDVRTLIRRLKHSKDSYDRNKAASALGAIADKRAVDALIAALGDKNERVRHSSINALGEIGDPHAIEPLTILLDDPSREVENAAKESIAKIKEDRGKKRCNVCDRPLFGPKRLAEYRPDYEAKRVGDPQYQILMGDLSMLEQGLGFRCKQCGKTFCRGCLQKRGTSYCLSCEGALDTIPG